MRLSAQLLPIPFSQENSDLQWCRLEVTTDELVSMGKEESAYLNYWVWWLALAIHNDYLAVVWYDALRFRYILDIVRRSRHEFVPV